MNNSFRRHWNIHWPFLLTTLVTFVGLISFFGWAAVSQGTAEWWLVSLILFVFLIIFVATQSWFYLQTERAILLQIPKWIVSKGRISSEDQVLFPYVADSRLAPPIITKLNLGKMWIVDIYNPKDMQSAAIRRTRLHDVLPEKDPRVKFIPGDMTLLPIQDGEIDVVVLNNVIQSITQAGDRERFLTEISRVMKPNGRLVMYETLNSPVRNLVDPLNFTRFWNKSELDQCLMSNGFSRIELQTPAKLTILGRATTPGRYENTPLPLEF